MSEDIKGSSEGGDIIHCYETAMENSVLEILFRISDPGCRYPTESVDTLQNPQNNGNRKLNRRH